MENEKQFLVQWGRGDATTLPLSHIKEHWDLDYKNDPDDDLEYCLGDWLEFADVGEEFVNEDDHQSFTRTE